MKRVVAGRVAWTLWAITIALALGSLLVPLPLEEQIGFDAVIVAFLLFLCSYGTVGALVASRLPTNPIGWLMIAAGLSYAVGGFAVSYTESVASGPWSLGARLVVWPGLWIWNVGIGLGGILLLVLFPTGHPPSPRWRPVVWAGIAGLALLSCSAALVPGRIEETGAVNPFGIEGSEPLLEVAAIAGLGLLLICLFGAVASLVARFRRSRGTERLQLKWLAYSGGLVAACLLGALPLEAAAGNSETATNVSNFLVTASLTTIPIAVGLAIFRYRLYDIDRIINRTLVYGLLTALLIGSYVVCVLLLQALLPFSDESAVAVAASTLATAALFGPLRRAVQQIVDRRFYRSRVDAARTIEEFSGRLRRETDLDALSADLIGVVRETVKPSHASLWLRAERES